MGKVPTSGAPAAPDHRQIDDARNDYMATEKTALNGAEEPTIGRLVNDATQDLSSLIRKEIALAKSELKVSIGFGAVGAGLFAAAAFLAVLAVIMFSVAIAYFINWNGSGLALHWAFLIVFGFYLLLAGLCVFVGIKKVKKVGPPKKAIAQGKEIPKALKGQYTP